MWTELPKETGGPFPQQTNRFMIRDEGNDALLTKDGMFKEVVAC